MSQIDPGVLAELKEDRDLERKAIEALPSADMNGFSIKKLLSRSIVGQLIAKNAAGNVQAHNALHQEAVEACSNVSTYWLNRLIKRTYEDELHEPDPKVIALLVNSVNQCAQSAAALQMIQLKAAEIFGASEKEKNQNALAPQLIATNMQVNIGEVRKPKPVLEPDGEQDVDNSGEPSRP